MSTPPTAVAVNARPISSAFAHAGPLILLSTVPLQLLATLLSRHSVAETAVGMSFTLIGAIVLTAWVRHGTTPCARCIRRRDREGKPGADKRQAFLRLRHHAVTLIISAVLMIVVGVGLTLWLGLSGHTEHALWPFKVGSVIAYLILAFIGYNGLVHTTFGKWCPVPHGQPKSA